MDMLKYKDFIEEGDLVIIYLDVKRLYPLTIKRDDVFQSKYGALKHNDCIGKRFGSCIACTKGWVYVLFPTPELWTTTLPHRTQILYAADISMIIVQLDLKPGAVVCEAGTGSGSLSHALLRSIAPNGFLYTFDFHELRVKVAQKEFDAHGLGSLVQVQCRDVCSTGFGLDEVADAVFLDLPNPWDAIPLSVAAFKKCGGRICTFSPCIEQVQRSCLALKENGFRDIVTVECLQRVFDVKKITQPVIGFDDDGTGESFSENSAIQHFDIDSIEKTDVPTNSETPLKRQHIQKEGKTVSYWSAIPPLHTPGHTGYLTYASYIGSCIS